MQRPKKEDLARCETQILDLLQVRDEADASNADASWPPSSSGWKSKPPGAARSPSLPFRAKAGNRSSPEWGISGRRVSGSRRSRTSYLPPLRRPIGQELIDLFLTAPKSVCRMFVGIAHWPEMEPGPVGLRRIVAKRFPRARHIFCRAKKGRGLTVTTDCRDLGSVRTIVRPPQHLVSRLVFIHNLWKSWGEFRFLTSEQPSVRSPWNQTCRRLGTVARGRK